MLVENLVNSKSIAIAASNDPSNKIPFLGLQWFPNQKRAGIDLRWVKTHKGLVPSLAPSNFDALPIIKPREGLKVLDTEMPFFRESKLVTERDIIDIARTDDINDPYVQSAVRAIYDDTNTLIRQAEVVPERMRMQLLSAPNGKPSISISYDNVNYTYDYDPTNGYSATNYLAITGSSTWDHADTSTPLDDLNLAKKALRMLGYEPKYYLLNSATWQYLLKSDQVKSILLTTNAAGVIYVTDDAVKQAVQAATGLIPVIYDKTFMDETGVTQKYFPDNVVTLLPEGQLGHTWYGTTPAERTMGTVDNADTSIYGAGIAVTTESKIEAGVYKFITTASEIVLPSYENMDSTFVIKVK